MARLDLTGSMLPKWLLVLAFAAGAGWISLRKCESPVVQAARRIQHEAEPERRHAAGLQLMHLSRQGCDLTLAHAPLRHAALRDPVPEIRATALEALASNIVPPAQWQDTVLQALRDPEPKVRRAGVYAISAQPHSQPLPPSWQNALLDRLLDPDPATHRAAALILVDRANLHDLVLPALKRCLAHSNAVIRRNAAQVLLSLGTRSRPAFAELQHALNDPDRKVRFLATRILALLEPAQARPHMIEIARSSPDELERLCAWDWLDRNVVPDAQLITEIENATRDIDPHVSRFATDTLARWTQPRKLLTLPMPR